MNSDNLFLDEAKALACVHCGLCLGACPTYLETGNENDSPRGRIYLMRALQAQRITVEEALPHIDRCLGCRACEVACPSGVQYGALLETTREHIEQRHRRSFFQTVLRRFVIEKVFPYARRMKWALWPARILKRMGRIVWLPRFIRDSVSLIPSQIVATNLPEFSPATTEESRGQVGLITGCVMSVMFGDTHRNTVRLLNAAGYDVVVPRMQECCGALFAHGGQLETARQFARRNIEVFERESLDAVIINAAGCGSTLKEYGHLLEGDREWAKRGMTFSAKVKDLSEFLFDIGFIERVIRESSIAPPSSSVTFHDACHLAHPQRITNQPRQLVKAIAGGSFVELPEADVCCGSAGSYNLTEPAMAGRLQQRKVRNIQSTRARTVVTTNPGCLLQINAGMARAGNSDVRVIHLADYLAEQLFTD